MLELEWPIVLNWSFELSEKVIDMHDVDNVTPLGMDVELSNNIDIEHLECQDSHVPDADNFTLTCNPVGNVPLYHSMHSHIKKIAKYEDHITDDMKDHIDMTLNSLLGTVVNNAKIDLNNGAHVAGTNKSISNLTDKMDGSIHSLHPNHEKRNKDKRLKAFWEV